MRLNATIALGVLALLTVPAAVAATAAGVIVELALVGRDAVDVTYRLPSDCNQLPLQTPFDSTIVDRFRAGWTRVGACGTLVDGAISAPPSCREVRFRVMASTETHDRVYPPAYPIDGLGIYLHTGAYAPTDACGPVRWRFGTKDGEVVFDGERRGPHYDVAGDEPSNASFTSVYLTLAPVEKGSEPITVFSAQVPQWVVETIRSASTEVDSRYRKLAGSATFRVPATVVSNAEEGDRPFIKADVANQRMLRVGLKNYATVRDSEDSRRFLRGLIAHEFAHTLQSAKLGATDTAWLAEGGAEFMRWMTLYRLGWRDGTQSAADLQDNLNQCLEAMGDRPWTATVDRRIPYTCGLVIHVLALAARKGKAGDAEKVLLRFYEALRASPTASPALWLECGGASSCTPQTLSRLLDSEGSFAAAVIKEAERLGVANLGAGPASPNAAIRDRGRIFAAVMERDCGGGFSFNNTPEKISVLPMERCKVFRGGEEVTGISGVSFMDRGRDANEAGRQECAKSGVLTLSLAKGAQLSVACPELFPPPIPRIQIDEGRLFALLV